MSELDDDEILESELPEYLHTDVPRDVLANLQLLEVALEQSNASWLKWAVIAGHASAMTAMVAYLTDTAGVGALTEKSTRETLEWFDTHPHPDQRPIERVAEFGELVRRISAGQCGAPDGEQISISDVREDLRRLNSIRNNFIHFREVSWMVEIAYVKPLLGVALAVVERVDQGHWAFRHASPKTRRDIRAKLAALHGCLAAPRPNTWASRRNERSLSS